jgi:thiol:disulfide interchange protein
MKNLTLAMGLVAAFALATTAAACGAEKQTMAEADVQADSPVVKTWVRSVDQYRSALASAADEKPVLVVYTVADCSDCRSVQSNALADANVVERLNRDYTVIHVDVTRGPGTLLDLLAEQRVKGVPAARFLDADGEEMEDLRLDGSFSTETLMAAMDRAENRTLAAR